MIHANESRLFAGSDQIQDKIYKARHGEKYLAQTVVFGPVGTIKTKLMLKPDRTKLVPYNIEPNRRDDFKMFSELNWTDLFMK